MGTTSCIQQGEKQTNSLSPFAHPGPTCRELSFPVEQIRSSFPIGGGFVLVFFLVFSR